MGVSVPPPHPARCLAHSPRGWSQVCLPGEGPCWTRVSRFGPVPHFLLLSPSFQPCTPSTPTSLSPKAGCCSGRSPGAQSSIFLGSRGSRLQRAGTPARPLSGEMSRTRTFGEEMIQGDHEEDSAQVFQSILDQPVPLVRGCPCGSPPPHPHKPWSPLPPSLPCPLMSGDQPWLVWEGIRQAYLVSNGKPPHPGPRASRYMHSGGSSAAEVSAPRPPHMKGHPVSIQVACLRTPPRLSPTAQKSGMKTVRGKGRPHQRCRERTE